jgi:hypothetical protein
LCEATISEIERIQEIGLHPEKLNGVPRHPPHRAPVIERSKKKIVQPHRDLLAAAGCAGSSFLFQHLGKWPGDA